MLFDDRGRYDNFFSLKQHSLLKRILHRLFWRYFAKKVSRKFFEEDK